jgi:hypothetical protein
MFAEILVYALQISVYNSSVVFMNRTLTLGGHAI